MQVRIFESPDMATGLRLIRKELGPDALILSTRTVRSGRLGLLGKPMLEITAAVDSPHPADSRPAETSAPAAREIPAAHRSYLLQERQERPEAQATGHAVQRLEQLLRSKRSAAAPEGSGGASSPPGNNNDSMLSEIGELKSMVESLAGEVSRLKQPPQPFAQQQAVSGALSAAQPPARDPVMKVLLDNGIDAETAATLSTFTRESLSFEELSDPVAVNRFLRECIGGLIKVEPPPFGRQEGQLRICLVGPTGVGKTTTLAKIAASYLGRHSRSVGLITIDTYRIAAVEQLKVYGEIMRLPVEVVVSPSQLETALAAFSDRELVLIDTAGRSPRDAVCLEELAAFLRPELDIETHLVLSAVSRDEELQDTINRFRTLPFDRTIFTKIDECAAAGAVLNTQIRNPSPLSYITNGQRVPEDLLEIDPDIVSRLIIPSIEGPES